MEQPVIRRSETGLATTGQAVELPILIDQAGEQARRRFIEFFTAQIRNKNTRLAYGRAVGQFCAWMDEHCHGVDLEFIQPVMVAAWVEHLSETASAPTVKQHLAAVRMLFDWMVVGQVMRSNPAAVVRGPKHVVKRGKTPVLSAEQARELLDSIPITRKDGTPDLVGLRDRALIGAMVYSFARVSAVANMDVGDYYQNGKRWWLRLHEKGGKFHEVPAHHVAEGYIDEYLKAAGIDAASGNRNAALFRSAIGRTGRLGDQRMTRNDVLRMIKRRAKAAGLPEATCCHTFRATGITAYLENGGTIENAQNIAAHESPRTTKLYDRTDDAITLDEIERIRI